MKYFSGILSLGTLLFGLASEAQLNCSTQCKRPTAQEIRDNPAIVTIDGNTGNVLTGSNEYREGTRVHLYVVNMNPYKYEYRIRVRDLSADRSNIEAFRRLIGGNPLGPLIGGTRVTPPSVVGGPGGPSPCNSEAQPVKDADTAITTARGDLVERAATLKADLAAMATSYDPLKQTYDQFVGDTDKDELNESECPLVCARAKALRVAIEAFRTKDLTVVATKLKADYLARKVAIDAAVAQMEGVLPSISVPNTTCRAMQADMVAKLKALPDDIDKLVMAAEEIETSKEKFQQLAKVIDVVQADDDAFVYHQVSQVSQSARNLEVRISRQNRRVKNAEFVRVKPAVGDEPDVLISVGQPRITVSGGIGFSSVEDVTVTRQKSKDDAGTGIVDRFAEENNSNFRPGAVALLNANIGSPFRFFGRVSAPALFSWSLGLVLTPSNNTTTTEYMTGPSIGFLDNNLVFTLAYHSARVKHLGGGFKVGDPIPTGLTDPLPVETDWEGGVMLAVTYKLR